MPAITKLGRDAGYVQTGATDLGAFAPFTDPDGLQNFFRTIRATKRGVSATDTLTYNDLTYAWRALMDRTGLGTGTQNSNLVVVDGSRVRGTLGNAQDGQFTTGSAAASTFFGTGGNLRPSANPTVHHFATSATYLSNVGVVGLFQLDSGDTGSEFGVLIRGTAATDHLRAEVRGTDRNVYVVTRAASTDTSNNNVAATTEIPANTLQYVAIGMRYEATGNVVKTFVNGNLKNNITASAGAQALTGNSVGVRVGGSNVRTGLVAFVAFPIS